MNCKPGDLAIVVYCINSANLGRVLRVVRPFPLFADAWEVEGQDSGKWAFDSWLRPIRNPGDDAQDETLQWLPVPSQHKEAA